MPTSRSRSRCVIYPSTTTRSRWHDGSQARNDLTPSVPRAQGGVGCYRRSIASPNARTMSLDRTRSSWPRVWSARSRAAIPTTGGARQGSAFSSDQDARGLRRLLPAFRPKGHRRPPRHPRLRRGQRQRHVPRPARYGEDPLGRGLKESAPVRRDTWGPRPAPPRRASCRASGPCKRQSPPPTPRMSPKAQVLIENCPVHGRIGSVLESADDFLIH
jgi:hypothetical protein